MPNEGSSQSSFEEGLVELRPTLDALRDRLVPEFGVRDFPDARVLWKTMSLYQCLIRRTLELIDGIEHSWDAQQHLVCTTLARSLVETAAFVWSLTAGVERGVEDSDLGIVDKLVMDHGQATRIISWVEHGLPKAKNILTMIDKMDRDINAKVDTPSTAEVGSVRRTYDLLSDFSHTNWLGVKSLYSTPDWDNSRYLFASATEDKHCRVGDAMNGALASVMTIDYCLRQMDKLVEPLHELNKIVPHK